MPASIIYRNIIEPVVSFILPAHCSNCHSPLPANRKVICQKCFSEIPKIENKLVEVLKREIGDNNFDDMFIVYQFDKTFQQIIHYLKYRRSLTIARYLAESLSSIITNQYDILTAVPLNPVRERERGYNQSDLIAGNLERIIEVPFISHLMKRTRNTTSQTKLNRTERIENVRGAFCINRDVDQKRILIIDDVITTGSTLNECARVLKKRGAAKIDIAALATPVNILQHNLEKDAVG